MSWIFCFDYWKIYTAAQLIDFHILHLNKNWSDLSTNITKDYTEKNLVITRVDFKIPSVCFLRSDLNFIAVFLWNIETEKCVEEWLVLHVLLNIYLFKWMQFLFLTINGWVDMLQKVTTTLLLWLSTLRKILHFIISCFPINYINEYLIETCKTSTVMCTFFNVLSPIQLIVHNLTENINKLSVYDQFKLYFFLLRRRARKFATSWNFCIAT